jgi:dTDP-4-amino-4,6-dideoxygalactose transaminase
MKIPFGKPMIGPEEKAAVMEVLEGPILVHGPRATGFEDAFAEFTAAPHAISVSSCTAGMHLIYFALGLGPGDEVIVPAQTHVATAHAVELTGAKAVFVDADMNTGNVDVSLIEAALTPNTKAIAVVHYLGAMVDMGSVSLIAKRHNLFLLEDCALAPGAQLDGVHAGLHGDAGVFSFYPVKHLTTAEGGMIILKDGALAERLRLLKAFGVDRNHGERGLPGLYDVVALGFNYRMSEIHAAIGTEQVKKLPTFLAQRRENHDHLESKLGSVADVSVIPQPVNERFVSSHYCLGMMLDSNIAHQRPKIMDLLKDQGVGTSIYYPHPVPRLKHYEDRYGFDAERFVNAAAISDQIIALPVGPHLTVSDMGEVSEAVKSVWNELNV